MLAVGAMPETEGFVFSSRFTGYACVAEFDRAFGKPRLLGIVEPARHNEFLDALEDFGIMPTEAPRS